MDAKTQKGSAIWNLNDWVTIQDIGGSKGFRGICALRFAFIIPRKAGYCNHLRVSVCLFVCLFVSRISQKQLVGFWWNLVSREVMIIGRPSSKLDVIRIEIRIWDPNNCFSWSTGRILDQDFNQIEENSNLIILIW